MSFTTGGLFHQETVTLSLLYLELGDWKLLRDKVLDENLLQARTQNTLKRVYREIVSRLKTLSPAELQLLTEADSLKQGYLLWIAACRRYKFIADFAVEVLRERYISLNTTLNKEDFDAFFNKKSEWHAEMNEIKPATRNKLRQVVFKMLREADLLTNNNTIRAAILTQKFLVAISPNHREDISYFPVFESDLKEIVQ